MTRAERLARVEREAPALPVTRQCELLALPRSSVYYERGPAVSDEDLRLMRLLDELHLKYPFMGSRRLRDELKKLGVIANRKRIQRLMRLMGLETLYPRKRTSLPNKAHWVFPYLLRDLAIDRPNQVWATDITYLPTAAGWVYLAVVLDLFSRKVVGWAMSGSLATDHYRYLANGEFYRALGQRVEASLEKER